MSAVSTWDPGLGARSKGHPLHENGEPLDGDDENLKGGAARVVADRVVPFIEQTATKKQLFFADIWFHAPHEDIKAGPDYLEKY